MKENLNEEHRELLEEYKNWLTGRQEKEGTILVKIRKIRNYLVYASKNQKSDLNIDERASKNYLNYLKKVGKQDGTTKYSPVTIENIQYILRSFSHFLVDTNRMEKNQFSHQSSKKKSIPSKYEGMIESYSQWLEVKGCKPRGIEGKMRNVKRYLGYCITIGISPEYAGARDAEDFRDYLNMQTNEQTGKVLSPSTVNNNLTDVRSFYTYLEYRGIICRNPLELIDYMKERKRLPKNILSISQMEKLLSSIPQNTFEDVKFMVLVEILYSTGARINEIAELCWEDVNFKVSSIHIRDDKTRKDRLCPLTERALHLLSVYRNGKSEGHVFPHGKTNSLNKWINVRLKRLTSSLGLPCISCHSIRHMVGTHLLQNRADIRYVQEYLGHRCMQSTEVYTRIFPNDLKNEVENRHPREVRSK